MATLIAALGPNNMLGRADGTLAWHEPCDMAIFTEHTRNKHLIVGPKTYNKLPDAMKKRSTFSVVLPPNARTHCAVIVPAGIPSPTVFTSFDKVLGIYDEQCVIIGGASLYDQALCNNHKAISQCIIGHIREPRDRDGNRIDKASQPIDGPIMFSARAIEYLVAKFNLACSFDISDRYGINVWNHK